MSDFDVAIIGGGPTGVAAALQLKRRGVARIVILEREAELGGVPRHCSHPPFGMREFGRVLTGPGYARRLRAAAEKSGADIRLHHSVVQLHPGGTLALAAPEGSVQIRALRVLLATGARESSRSARLLGGDRPLGIINTGALQAHLTLHGTIPFRRPVVVGTELVALSALATCRRHGIAPVAMLESGARPTARWPLTLLPSTLRIPLHLRSEIAEIHGTGRVENVKLHDGREISCDGVLLTGNFVPESTLARMGHLAIDPGTGGPLTDQYGRCSDAAFFAAGNLLRGVETAGWCFREGAKIADYIADDFLSGLPYHEGGINIICGPGIKYAMPQMLTRVTKLRGELQLRVSQQVRGQLRIIAGGSVLYKRRIAALPERRILIDLEHLRIPHDISQITVEILA
jgi:NADPH-dependent 2,4-dienoyl-CoA reductase/sulfur reductase-like enzyme